VTYLPIEHHGVIGDLYTAALVGMDGTIDWLCLPDFDSPSVFASILDSGRGGFFRITATSEGVRRKQMYLPDSNVLVTRFLTPDGVGEIVDFMPVHEGPSRKKPEEHQLIRIVRGVRGCLPFRMECRPAFDYARRQPRVMRSPWGYRFEDDGHGALDLATKLDAELDEHGIAVDFELKEGDEVQFILALAGASACPPPERLAEFAEREFRNTLAFWQAWIGGSHYQGHWREMVKRSCLALKLMTYSPTGAIVAAPTCSLPEHVGGMRNWDYRYAWIRDSAFTVYTLLRVGFTSEAARFMDFLEERCREMDPARGLQVLYGIDGRHDIPEEELPHLEGYRGSKPVRIGNAAAKQFQLDVNGELVDAMYLFNKYGEPLSHGLWTNLRRLVDWVCDHWEKPDEGIWEVRGGPRQFTFSKLMSWVALDRGLRLAAKRGLPADHQRWIDNRDAIYERIMSHGFSAKKHAFVQSLDGDALDASMLLAPMVKFVSPKDHRMLGTLDAIQRELVSDHLVKRYDPRLAPDSLDGDEGTFSMCTFWLAEALARAGRIDEARLIFEKMLGYANHLGLYSEELGLTGEALGNFPQAFTHLGLISAAYNISSILDGKPQGVHQGSPPEP